jgi:hypothetical protein
VANLYSPEAKMMKRAIVLCVMVVAVSVAILQPVQAVTFTQLTTDPSGDFRPDWSPLGDKIVFVSDRTGPFRLWVIPIAGGTPTKISELGSYGDEEPKWSPDANYILFQSRGGRWDLFTMTSTGDSVTRRTFTDDRDENNPDWSPDGSKIVWTRANGSGILQVRDLAGGTPLDLTYGQFPSWSPDGGWITYMYQDDIYVISASGDSTYRLTTNPGRDMLPDWSPDGSWIAFTSNRSGNNDIWVMDSRGESFGLWQITDHSGDDQAPSWSPDGKKIVFQSDRSGNRDIWVASNLGIPETGPGWISGVVKDAQTANPLYNATVRTTTMPYGGDQTNQGGDYSATLPAGSYQLQVSAPGYETQTRQVQVQPDQTQTENFNLTPKTSLIRYVGPKQISGKSFSVISEDDGKITCGDHVQLELRFRNEGGPSLSSNISLSRAMFFPSGFPKIYFSTDGVANWQDEIQLQVGPLQPREIARVRLWIYVENMSYESRRLLQTPHGFDQEIWMFYGPTGFNPDERLTIYIEPIDFSYLVPGEKKEFLMGDCLCDPRRLDIQCYAQYAGGGRQISPGLDPDTPYKTLFNILARVADPTEFQHKEDFWGKAENFFVGRHEDYVLLSRRGGQLGVCIDYTDLMTSLLRSVGLPTRRVYTTFPPVCGRCLPIGFCLLDPPLAQWSLGTGHAWNEVFISDKWFYADAFWFNLESSSYTKDDVCLDCRRPNIVYAESYPLCYTGVVPLERVWCSKSCYEDIDCDKCKSDLNPLFGSVECFANEANIYGGHCSKSSQNIPPRNKPDSLSMSLIAPIYLSQNVPFTLHMVLTNSGLQTQDSLVLAIHKCIYADDTFDFFTTPDSFLFIDSLAAQTTDTVDIVVTPLLYGHTVPLVVSLITADEQADMSAILNINESGTPSDLILRTDCTETELQLGISVSFTATVHDTIFGFVGDATVKLRITSVDSPAYFDTINMSYSAIDSVYSGSLLLPPSAPIGTYLAQITASKQGFEEDTTLAYFHVSPTLMVSSSSDTSVYSTNDTLFLSATATERDSLVAEANVTAKIDIWGDSIFVPLFFDSTDVQYKTSIVLRDLATHFTGLTIPSGLWNIYVSASYLGGLGADSIAITVQVPDLSVSSSDISFDVTNPQEGDLVAIFAEIHNTGDFISDSCQIHFYYDFISNNRRIGPTCPISPISPGDSVTICVMWNTFGYGGEGTIYAVIDPDSTTVQSSRANDIASHTITVGQLYLRGDVNNDQVINVSDVVYLINYLFINGPEPKPFLWIGDVNWDGNVNVSDAVYLINYLFISGPPPCEP